MNLSLLAFLHEVLAFLQEVVTGCASGPEAV
jgi:hypothetical protein